jgi:hypothetical protein
LEIAYRNIAYLLLVLPLILIAGFWIPYFSEIPRFEPSITAAVHIHAFLLFAWAALMVVQPLAIRTQSFALHRILGKASYVLMPLVLISGCVMLRKEYQEGVAGGMAVAQARRAEYLSAIQLALIAAFYCLAVVRIRRRDAAEHMRYMICIALALLPAGLARTLGYWFGVGQSSSQAVCFVVIDLCLIALILFDRRRRVCARPYGNALTAYLIVETGWLLLGRPV